MPLADKIIELRKKQGWSQIDLADRLDVSRQSVSKWEMAQAVPELDKIIKMSELFAVTTDYLLKDDAPAPEGGPNDAPPPAPPEEPPQAGPAPEPEAPPQTGRKPRKKWPWILAAAVVLVMALNWALIEAGVLAYRDVPTPPPFLVEELPEPSPIPEANSAEETVAEEPIGEAVSDPEIEDGPAMEMATYEAGGYTVNDIIDEDLLAAIAAEYAPYGITCEDGRWYYEGRPIRVFTDVLASNGESMTGGHFQGTMRNFAGDGDIDVRTVRDYDHCGADGNGALLYIETCPAHGDVVWTAHHAEGHHELRQG